MNLTTIQLIDKIKETLSNKPAKNGLHVDAIAMNVINMTKNLFEEPTEKSEIKAKINDILNRESKKSDGDFSKVKNPKTNKFRKGVYKLRQQKSTIPDPKPPMPIFENNKPEPEKEKSTLFIGKAGECAVMSELLYRKYNANSMMVDDGVDIVASKNNAYYFIQVKTTEIDENGRIYTHIKRERFDTLRSFQIRYIIVARCKMGGFDTNLFFVFTNRDVENFIHNGTVNSSDTQISFKIRIDKEKGNMPILYNGNKESQIDFFMNNFELSQ